LSIYLPVTDPIITMLAPVLCGYLGQGAIAVLPHALSAPAVQRVPAGRGEGLGRRASVHAQRRAHGREGAEVGEWRSTNLLRDRP
jgi:hypothetical protein